MARYKRKILLIKKGLQFRMMAVMMLTALLSVLFCMTVVVLALRNANLLDVIINSGVTLDLFINGAFLTIAFTICVCYLVGIYGSHKIAGPIYRFEVTARKIAEGDLTDARIWLRKGDQFQDLCALFNVILGNERKLIAGLKEVLESLIDVMVEQDEQPADAKKIETEGDEPVEDSLQEAVDLLSDLTKHYEI